MPPKKNFSQADARRHRFSVSQYWSINFYEKDEAEQRAFYSCVIKAKSLYWAKRIIAFKMNEDSPSLKIGFTCHCYWIHKDYHMARNGNRKLTIEDWDNIRGAAFPNAENTLFKVPCSTYKPRTLSPRERVALKKKGFQPGSKNWSHKFRRGTSLPLEERSHKIYRGAWFDWDPEERALEKDKLIRALVKHNNNRSGAARYLGFNRNKIYDLFAKFPEVNWNKEYPPSKSNKK